MRSLFVLTALFVFASTQGRQLAVSGEFQVNSVANGRQSSPAIATLANGGFVIAWSDSGQTDIYNDVYAQLYSSSGDAVGTVFLVNTFTSSHQIEPAIASLSGGGFVVVWSRRVELWDIRSALLRLRGERRI